MHSAPKHTLPSVPRPIHAAPPSTKPATEVKMPVVLSEVGQAPKQEQRIRGPWEHASGVDVKIDVALLLPLPKPAVVNVGRQTV